MPVVIPTFKKEIKKDLATYRVGEHGE